MFDNNLKYLEDKDIQKCNLLYSYHMKWHSMRMKYSYFQRNDVTNNILCMHNYCKMYLDIIICDLLQIIT